MTLNNSPVSVDSAPKASPPPPSPSESPRTAFASAPYRLYASNVARNVLNEIALSFNNPILRCGSPRALSL